MKPIVHGLHAKYGDRIGFVYIDIEDPRGDELKRALNYRVQPHFVLLDAQGNILQQWVGSVSEGELESALQAALTP